MSVDKNNVEFPDYMDIQFFETAMKNGLNDKSTKVQNVKFTQGHKPGENYCSVIYRADVTYSTSTSASTTVSLIIKTQVLDDEYKTADFFGKETDMYTLALPQIESMLGNIHIAPKMYYSARTPNDVVVFHDMTPEGYLLADRVKGLDEKHCAMVLEKLAKLHAASIELARADPKVKTIFEIGMINNESRKFVETLLFHNISDLEKLVATWPGFESIAVKLLSMRNNIFEIFLEANEPKKGELSVLTHNDLWTNNILFKYNGDEPVDVLLIDYQASFYCSPGIDITHFLYTTPYFHLLENKREYMIEEYYYKPFKATLEKVGYLPIPTLEDIYQEIENREMSGFLWACAKLYLICMDKKDCEENSNSIDALGDPEIGGQIRAKGMSSERYQATMKYMLKRMDKLGKL